MSEFTNDNTYESKEQTSMEEALNQSEQEIKAKLKVEQGYILGEIAHANIEFLNTLDVAKKQSMINKIKNLDNQGTAKQAFNTYITRKGYTDYESRDATKIASVDPKFFVAIAQALTIHCCQTSDLLKGSIVNRKSGYDVDGYFGPNTLFAMTTVFKQPSYFGSSNEKFNGLLSDGTTDAGGHKTTLLDKLLEDNSTGDIENQDKKALQESLSDTSGKKLKEALTSLITSGKTNITETLQTLYIDPNKTTINIGVGLLLYEKSLRTTPLSLVQKDFLEGLKQIYTDTKIGIRSKIDQLLSQSETKESQNKSLEYEGNASLLEGKIGFDSSFQGNLTNGLTSGENGEYASLKPYDHLTINRGNGKANKLKLEYNAEHKRFRTLLSISDAPDQEDDQKIQTTLAFTPNRNTEGKFVGYKINLRGKDTNNEKRLSTLINKKTQPAINPETPPAGLSQFEKQGSERPASFKNNYNGIIFKDNKRVVQRKDGTIAGALDFSNYKKFTRIDNQTGVTYNITNNVNNNKQTESFSITEVEQASAIPEEYPIGY